MTNRKQSQNSIDATANDLQVFLEYVYNAQEIFFERNICTSSTLLSEIILSYPDYLCFASKSQKLIARETAIITGREPVKKSSANRYLSSVNSFVSASAAHHETLKHAKEHGLIDIDVSSENIHASLLKRRELSSLERKNLRERSVLAQVVSNGGRYTKTNLFATDFIANSNKSDEFKYFPISHLDKLLDVANSYRDRALWALLAGAGLRMSEASQLLVSDVDIINETLNVFTYRDRVESFVGIKMEDVGRLSFKGRETAEAYFIYPLGKVFFDSIVEYLKHERPKGLGHNYLFVTNGNRSRGRPLFATSRSNRLYGIKNAQKAINCPPKNEKGHRYALHSLRHFYGYWLLNFHQTPEGHRFSLQEVQHMIGHAVVNSTKKYAVTDRLIAKEKMRLANLVLENKSVESHAQLLLEHQQDVIRSLLSGINNEN